MFTLCVDEREQNITRWHPQGLQKFVSTDKLDVTWGGGGVNLGSLKSKRQVLAKFQWGGGSWGAEGTGEVNWTKPQFRVNWDF